MTKKAIAIFAMSTLMFGCRPDATEETADIVIGAVLPLTGQYADNGNSIKAGLELAIEDLNARAVDYRYTLFCYDTHSEVRNATIGFNRLNDFHSIDLFVTTMSDNSMALKPLAVQKKKFLFCIASHTGVTDKSDGYVYRAANTGADESRRIIRCLKDEHPEKNMFLYTFNTDAGLDIARTFEENLGGKMIGKCVYDDNRTVLKSITTKDSYKNADCIAVIGFSPYMGSIIRSLRESGFVGTIFSNIGFNSSSIIAASGEAAKSVRFVDYAFPYGTEDEREKNARSQKLAGVSFSAMSYLAYENLFAIDHILGAKSVKDAHRAKKLLLKEASYDVNGIGFDTKSDGSLTVNLVMRSLE